MAKTTETPFTFSSERPLEHGVGESLRANTALRDYVFLGNGRSLRKLLEMYEKRGQSAGKAGAGIDPFQEPPTLRLATLEGWSTRYLWQERVAALEALRMQEDARKWAERQDQQRNDEWLLRNHLLDDILAMQAEVPKFVKSRKRVVKETNQEIITLALDGQFMLKAMELFSKFGRLSSGMETEKQSHEHSGPNGGPIEVFDLEQWKRQREKRKKSVEALE